MVYPLEKRSICNKDHKLTVCSFITDATYVLRSSFIQLQDVAAGGYSTYIYKLCTLTPQYSSYVH
jgi:hypothetical protein